MNTPFEPPTMPSCRSLRNRSGRCWPISAVTRSGGPNCSVRARRQPHFELLGAELRLRPLGGYRFTCRVVAFEKPRRINLAYSGGFIAGIAEWRLEPVSQGTRVVYDIDLQVVHSRLAAFAHWAVDLGRVHSFSMQAIFRNLRRELLPPHARS